MGKRYINSVNIIGSSMFTPHSHTVSHRVSIPNIDNVINFTMGYSFADIAFNLFEYTLDGDIWFVLVKCLRIN